MITKVVAISAGHHPKAKGAVWHGVNEHDLARIIVDRLELILEKHGIAYLHVPTGTLPNKVKFINDNKPVSLAIEIHFNAAASGVGHGVEALYFPGNMKARMVAEDFCSRIANALEIKNRGAKEGWYKMDRPGKVDYHGDVDGDETIDYFLRATHCQSVILEPEFLSNAVSWGDAQIGSCCWEIATSLSRRLCGRPLSE